MRRSICIVLTVIFCFLTACGDPLPQQEATLTATLDVSPAPTAAWPQATDRVIAQTDIAPNEFYHWKRIVHNSAFQLDVLRQNLRDGEYSVALGNYPCIDGSTVLIPMAEEFARQHLNLLYPYEIVAFNKTHNAYVNLIFNTKNNSDDAYGLSIAYADSGSAEDLYLYNEDGDEVYDQYHRAAVVEHGTDLILVTAPSQEELDLAASNGVELVMKPICMDAFVFITYLGNPVTSLTIQQIRDIYSGKITNWMQVGGENLPIRAFTRNANSGSQTAMENLVMQGTPFSPSLITEDMVVDDMGSLLLEGSRRDEHGGGLGYTYKYYMFHESGEGFWYSPAARIQTLSVNGIEPSTKNIANSSYPFSVNYYGVIRKGDEDSVGGRFLNWILSPEGQACICQAGYIALDGRQADFYFDGDGFIFPDSSNRVLTEADFARLQEHCNWDTPLLIKLLGFARNEIFARHGNQFKTPAYATHYSQYAWYNALTLHSVSSADLSKIEETNVTLIQKWEREAKAED